MSILLISETRRQRGRDILAGVHEPSLGPEPGWTPVEPFRPLEPPAFVSGDRAGDRLRVRYFRRGDGSLAAKAWFGPGAEGPPGHAHGGSIAAVLDEAMGAVAFLHRGPVLASQITVRFLLPVPLGPVFPVEARVTRDMGRVLEVTSALLGPGREPLATADGVFAEVGPEQMRRFLGGAG
jgi:acyl-coenzyme A thioesterase PaaI-like protein